MKVFFDNCTAPALADTLDGYLRHLGSQAVHVKDLPCGRNAADIEWIAWLASTGDEWLVLTGDLRIQRNRAERQAFRQAGLRGVVFAPGYQGFRMNERASFMLWRWPDLETLVRSVAPPFLFELPANRTSRLRSLPL